MVLTLYILTLIGLLLNTLGIYCLYKQEGDTRKQRILLANLSFIEIIKMIYNYVSLTFYHYKTDWYIENYRHFDVVEVSIMSVLYASMLVISIDRLSCLVLHIKYNCYVTEKLIKLGLIIVWLMGFACGPVMWFLISDNEYAKIYYYMTFDIAIIIAAGVTYLLFGRLIKQRNRTFVNDRSMKNLKNLFLVPSLIVTTFVLFNAIPDLIMVRHFNKVLYNVTAILWVLGLSSDPLIYIFLNRKSRGIALDLFRKVKPSCCSRYNHSFDRETNV